MPVSKVELKRQSRHRVLLSLFVLVVSTSLTASIFMLDDYRNTKKAELNSVDQRLMILEQKTLNGDVVANITRIINKKSMTIETLSNTYSQTSYQIKLIKSLTPQGIVFKQLSKSDTNQYLLAGSAENPNQIADFVYALRTSESFSDAFLQNINAQSSEVGASSKDFAILLKIKEVTHEVQ